MKLIKVVVIITFMIVLMINSKLQAQALPLPGDIAAKLLVKVIEFEKNISKQDIVIYVQGAPDVAKELEKMIGQAGIVKVVSGPSLPASKPTIYFVNNAGHLAEALKYTRQNKVLSVSNYPSFVPTGVTLGLGVGQDNKAKIILNVTASEEEGVDWEPAIMKVAKIVK